MELPDVEKPAEATIVLKAGPRTLEFRAAIAPVRKWEIYVIQHLEQIIGTVLDNMDQIDVGEVNVLDRGDGSALAAYAAAYPQTVAAVLRALRETVGIDIPAVLEGSGAAAAPPKPPLPGGSPTSSLLAPGGAKAVTR